MLRLVLERRGIGPCTRRRNRGRQVARALQAADPLPARATVQALEAGAPPIGPGLETVAVRYGEAGQELAAVEVERGLGIARLDGALEVPRIDRHRGPQAYAVALGDHRILAQRLAHFVQRLTEAMACGRPGLVGPERGQQRFTRAVAFHRDVHQESAAQSLLGQGGPNVTVHPNPDLSEGDDPDGQCSSQPTYERDEFPRTC